MIKRLTISLHEDVYSEVLKICGKEDRSISFVLNSLIQKALKEKNRKRTKSKSLINE
jgi:predicted CopG family antitoxin